MTYSLNDICIIPARISRIEHRSECNPYKSDGMLPLFTAPMNSVIDEHNYQIFLNNKINTIIPRGVDFNTRWELSNKTFVAIGLNEFTSFIDRLEQAKVDGDTRYVCIDIANGHMKKLIDLCKKAKRLFGSRLIIMTGNIANPMTYYDYAKAGIDYVRCGIGGGSACFVAGTKVTMANGSKKNIEDIDAGEYIKTLNGSHKVINVYNKITKQTIVINKSVECTPNHQFLVINKKDKNKVNETNLHEYSFYIEAKHLTSDYLLVEMK